MTPEEIAELVKQQQALAEAKLESSLSFNVEVSGDIEVTTDNPKYKVVKT